jgi:hypothetical protein
VYLPTLLALQHKTAICGVQVAKANFCIHVVAS